MLSEMRLRVLTDDIERGSDFIIFNTCAVREHAEDRVYGNIGVTKALKQAESESNWWRFAAVWRKGRSCGGQIYKRSYPYVDMVLGTQQFSTGCLNLSTNGFRARAEYSSCELVQRAKYPRAFLLRVTVASRAGLPIMYGCDNFLHLLHSAICKRGRERSRQPAGDSCRG